MYKSKVRRMYPDFRNVASNISWKDRHFSIILVYLDKKLLLIIYSKKNGLSSGKINFNYDLFTDKIVNDIYIADADSVLFNNIKISEGSRILKPINISGFRTYSTNFSHNYFLWDNKLNLNILVNYRNNKGILPTNEGHKTYFDRSLVNKISITNNGRKIRANLSYQYHITFVDRPLIPKTSLLKHTFSNNIMIIGLPIFRVSSNFHYTISNNKIYDNIPFINWNLSLQKGIFKGEKGLLNFQIYNVLNNKQNSVLNIGSHSVINDNFRTVGRFFIISLSYNFRKFGL